MQNEKITSIIYRNSHDCGEGLTIKFENILKVISELSAIGSEVFSLAHFPLNGLVHINGEEYNITKKVLEPAKPGYEIQSFKVILPQSLIYDIRINGEYWFGECASLTLEACLKNVADGFMFIHSVKRLPDGEVFTVRDILEGNEPIKKITINKIGAINLIRFDYSENSWISLITAEKVKQPPILFITEDNVSITDSEQIIFWIDHVFKGFNSKAKELIRYQNSKFFSTQDARDEYILYNKPVTTTYKEYLNSPDILSIDFFKSKQNNG